MKPERKRGLLQPYRHLAPLGKDADYMGESSPEGRALIGMRELLKPIVELQIEIVERLEAVLDILAKGGALDERKT